METILANLRANEELFANCSVRWRETCHNENPRPLKLRDRPDMLPLADLQVEASGVTQNGMFFLDWQGDSLSGTKAASKRQKLHVRRAFDGSETRLLELAGIYVGNVIRGPAYDGRQFDPHGVVLRRVCFSHIAFPLSAYLAGSAAIRTHPRAADYAPNGEEITCRYETDEDIAGLKCHRIVVDRRTPDRGSGGAMRPSDKIVIWLAIERNYLPIKTVAYNLFYSKDIPIEERTLKDLRQIATGVWFPFRCTLQIMDQIELLERKKAVLSSVEEWTVSDVSLNPKYDVGFFRDVKFPDGAPVYYVVDKKIIKSHIQGDKPLLATLPSPSRKAHGRNWWWLLNIAAAAILLGWIAVRRVRRTRTSE